MADADATGQMANLHLDEVTGEKVRYVSSSAPWIDVKS